MRSKVFSYAQDFLENEIMVGLIQEIWEKQEDTVFHDSIEEIFQTNGLQYFSNPRHPYKRGGGTAIVVDTSKILFEKLNISIPHNLEIIWGILRPKTPSVYKVIVVASFYLPPKSKKRTKLFDHVSETLQLLLCKYPQCGILIGGD